MPVDQISSWCLVLAWKTKDMIGTGKISYGSYQRDDYHHGKISTLLLRSHCLETERLYEWVSSCV